MDNSVTRFKLGRLIDGTGAPFIKGAVMAVKNGHILSVSRQEEAGRDPVTIDLSMYTVLPCLVDCHVHLAFTGDTDPAVRKNLAQADVPERKRHMMEQLKRHLSCGVTAVRDGGDRNGDALFMKKYMNSHETLKLFTLHTAGKAWHAKGRYGALIGGSVGRELTLAEAVVQNTKDIDHIKLVNSGLNSLTRFGMETPPQFELEMLKKTVDAARQVGLKTMIHANGKQPVKLAVMAGCDSIEHGFFMGRDNLKKMADMGITWIPTACTMKAYHRYLNSQGPMKDASFAEVSLQNLEHQMEQISQAKTRGVTIALGTDAGSPGVVHGSSVKDEMDILVQSGYSIEEAVKCATSNGAKLMGLEKKGTLTKGMKADFIAIKADISHLVDQMDRIDGIYIGGRKISI